MNPRPRLLLSLKFVWIVLTGWSMFFSEAVRAQQDSVSRSNEYFKMGMEVYDFSHRKQATELFVQACQMNPKNARAQLMAGKSIMLTINKEKSLSYFLRALKLDPFVHEDILYYIGQGYHYAEKFDSAILFYNAYNRKLARSLDFKKSVKMTEVDRKTFECRNAIVFKENPVNVIITDMSQNINSEYPDYAPTITADGSLMIFTSRRPDNNANPNLSDDHEYYEEVYQSRKVNGEWQPAQIMPAPVNSIYHNASVSIAPDGSQMFIYNDTNGGDIYVTYQHNGIWSEEIPLEGDVNTPDLENSAALSADGQKLFFTSTRPGGYGGTDIYFCTKGHNGRWINATNLGPIINTELDEDGIFISPDGKYLYFSSNGLAGMGDLDIYRSTLDPVKDTWGPPVNMGYPINSPENDIYFVLAGNENIGYFSSVKSENKGEQDIYKVDMTNWKELHVEDLIQKANPDPTAVNENVPEKNNVTLDLNLVVMDAKTFALLDARIDLIDHDKKIIPVPAVSIGNHVLHIAGKSDRTYRYGVKASSGDYLDYESHFYLVGKTDQPGTITDTIYMKKNIPFQFTGILNLYFPSNGVLPQSMLDVWAIERFLKQNLAATVIIAGHTDNYGEAGYNLSLSQRRAETVKKYLVDAGIQPDRVTAVGYGEERPIADNTSAKGRSLNRRTEFTILNSTNVPRLKKEY
jgi:outer membrane protein OmpA-like peptidoglycan-associated protein